MRSTSGKIFMRGYVWTIASLYRVAMVAVLTAIVLTAVAYYTGVIYTGLLAALLLFGYGAAAYQVRNSGMALDFPGVDRFFQRVPCYLSIQDRDLRIIRVNRLFRQDFGQRIGEHCYKVYKGADEACPDCPVLKTFEDGQTHTTQESVITKDGRKVEIIVYTTPVKDEEGVVMGVMEMSTNITEVKQLQQEIEAKRQEYQNLFDRVPCYLSTLDREFRILRVNEQFRKEFGGKVGEFCHKIYYGRDTVCPDCHVAKTFEDGEIHSREKTVTKPDGSEARLIVYASPIHDEKGELSAVMEMATDITEIKALQDKLQETQARFQQLFEGVPCYISIQNRDLKIIDANQRFKDHFGDRPGTPCYEVYKKRSTACPECPVMMTFEDGLIHTHEEKVINSDGSSTDMLVQSSPINDENGDCTAVMEVSTDIGEVKHLQRELTYMGLTVAVMAHRIKNILMGLEGGIFVVNTGFEDGDHDTLGKGWKMIERNVGRVSAIVKDLLYCSKERQMSFELLDPGTVLCNVHELFHDRAVRDGVDLILELQNDLPDGQFDRDALHSLITNLVTNAIDACVNDSRENRTEQHRVIIKANIDHRENYRFEVSDNGPGIPGHVGESVFDDFFSTKGREGTGLGLLVANKVAAEHAGTITFESLENIGTTFRAVIPRKTAVDTK
ncbi:MAG: hypothetical protein DRP45_02855 [Candidatus Zixiibacteriota bacterium]|nr:MAG: hypothetical protein DRP45_02855 [candidate division Zixibacteria bacterium]